MTTRPVTRLWRESLVRPITGAEVEQAADALGLLVLGWHRPGRLTLAVRAVERTDDEDVALLRLRGRGERGTWFELTSSLPGRRGFIPLRAQVLDIVEWLGVHSAPSARPAPRRAAVSELPRLAVSALRELDRWERRADPRTRSEERTRVERSVADLSRALSGDVVLLLTAAQRPWIGDTAHVESAWARVRQRQPRLLQRVPPLWMQPSRSASVPVPPQVLLAELVERIGDVPHQFFPPRKKRRRPLSPTAEQLRLVLSAYHMLARAVLTDDRDLAVVGGQVATFASSPEPPLRT